jgi:hypothetical protein
LAPDRKIPVERARSRGDLAVVEFESVSPRRDHDVDGAENLKPSKGMPFGTAVRAGLGN